MGQGPSATAWAARAIATLLGTALHTYFADIFPGETDAPSNVSIYLLTWSCCAFKNRLIVDLRDEGINLLFALLRIKALLRMSKRENVKYNGKNRFVEIFHFGWSFLKNDLVKCDRHCGQSTK